MGNANFVQAVGLALVVLTPFGVADEVDAPASRAAFEFALQEPPAKASATERNGQQDFDFSFGTWRTEVRVRPPLSGSAWSEYAGTSVVRPIWGGRANLVELDVAGSAGRIIGLNLRLYDPQARRWNLHYANSRTGELTPPVTGSFTNGVGEFTNSELLEGRKVLVKFVISQEAPRQWRYVQSYSGDGGETWEANWIAIDTLVSRTAEGEED